MRSVKRHECPQHLAITFWNKQNCLQAGLCITLWSISPWQVIHQHLASTYWNKRIVYKVACVSPGEVYHPDKLLHTKLLFDVSRHQLLRPCLPLLHNRMGRSNLVILEPVKKRHTDHCSCEKKIPHVYMHTCSWAQKQLHYSKQDDEFGCLQGCPTLCECVHVFVSLSCITIFLYH